MKHGNFGLSFAFGLALMTSLPALAETCDEIVFREAVTFTKNLPDKEHWAYPSAQSPEENAHLWIDGKGRARVQREKAKLRAQGRCA